jgi:hypothetical protein
MWKDDGAFGKERKNHSEVKTSEILIITLQNIYLECKHSLFMLYKLLIIVPSERKKYYLI